MIIDHDHPRYRDIWNHNNNKYNGAYYYSQEITEIIIPNVNTNRNWITVNVPGVGVDHSIIFVHNNKSPERYDWLKKYKDIILVCGVPDTVDKVKHLGTAVYLPLSINVKKVEHYKRDSKDKGACFAGRKSKTKYDGVKLPDNIEYLWDQPRDRFLTELARYRVAYCVGRAALEAKILGAEVRPYDPRYPDPDIWQVIDSLEAAKRLNKILKKID